jgi:hypothetical protein
MNTMNQEQKELIINSVNELGLADTLTIVGGNKDIIRKAYIDNPERYMDNLIGNILKEHKPVTNEIYFYRPIVVGDYNNGEVIFECKRPDYEFKLNGNLYVSRVIWNYFYVNFMGFNTEEIQNTIKSWITKNIPDLSSLTPVCKQPDISKTIRKKTNTIY